METFDSIGIYGVKPIYDREQSLECPKCSSERRKKNLKPLSVNYSKQAWKCNHCGWAGILKSDNPKAEYIKPKTFVIPEITPSPLTNKAILWFQSERGINQQTLNHFKIYSDNKYFHDNGTLPAGVKSCIAFPYLRNEVVINCKYRDGAKRFTLETGAELIAYNENSITGATSLLIVEGEIDVLSCYQSGHRHVISPPNGANLHRNNLEWLDRIYDRVKDIPKILIGVDNDIAGENLKIDLIRRFGTEKCFLVSWLDCKDANEVLLKYGESVVMECISNASQMPIEGIVVPEDNESQVRSIYENGLPPGSDIPTWSEFSQMFKFLRGEFMAVTGVPTHGKSVWCENVMVNLAIYHGWKFGICVYESDPDILTVNLMQIYLKRSMFGKDRFNQDDFNRAMDFVNEHFRFFDVGEQSNTLDAILSKGEELVRRFGIDMLYIDPWSYVEKDKGSLSDGQFFEACLPKMKSFRRRNDCMITIVAHPRKIEKDKSGEVKVPDAYDISGTNQWYGAPDKIITVYAKYNDDGIIEHHAIHIFKQKKWWLGKKGVVNFKMLPNGNFVEMKDYISRQGAYAIPGQVPETSSGAWIDYKSKQSNDDNNTADNTSGTNGEYSGEFDDTAPF